MKLGAYEYYLFDWDGTLAQTPEIWIDAIEVELKNFGVANPSRAEIARQLGSYQIGFFYGLSGEREAAFQKAMVKTASEHLPKAELYDHAAAVLAELRRQHKKLALKKLGCQDKTKALMLGDTDKDMRAAQGASIDTLLFYPPAHQSIYDLAYLQSFNPTHVIHGWPEFIKLIN